MKTTCRLPLLLILMGVLMFTRPVSAQTEPFEGLRFYKFDASVEDVFFSTYGDDGMGNYVAAYFNTKFIHKFQVGSNASLAVHFLSRMDYSTALFTNLSPVLEATNTFSLQADGSAGALDVDGVRAALEGLGLAHNGAEVLDQPIAPFLGKGTISSVGY